MDDAEDVIESIGRMGRSMTSDQLLGLRQTFATLVQVCSCVLAYTWKDDTVAWYHQIHSHGLKTMVAQETGPTTCCVLGLESVVCPIQHELKMEVFWRPRGQT